MGAASAVEDSTLNNTIATTSGGGVLSVPMVESADVLSAQTYEISGSSFDDIQNFFDTTQLESGDIVYLGNTNYRSTWQAQETKYITLNTNGIIISGGSLANPNGISTLDGNGGRIFKLNASGITLTNIEFTNAGDSNGGAITGESLATNTIIENCNFTNNKGAWGNPGTAIYLMGSNSEFNNCNFKENYVSGSLIHTTGTTNFNNCIFDNNNDPGWSVTYLINNEGITNINNCNFTNNHPGAIYSAGTTNVVNSNFTDNAGAGIYSVGNVEITDSVFKGYTGTQYNNKNIGAVYSGGTTTVENSVFDRNAASNNGYGGIYSEGATNVVNSNFTQNTGGAIYSGANAEISGCIIANNSGTNSAVDVYGTAIIDNCNFTGNALTNNDHAGALSVTGDNSKITNCNFDNNKAGYGAAIYNTGANLLIDNCNFTNNMLTVAYGFGGAIQSTGVSTSVNNSKFKKNGGGASGGAIQAESSGFTASNCEFEENTANNGGGLYIGNDDAILTNCNFTSNSAANQGGAIYILEDCYNADMSYCNFKDNSATSGTAIYAANGANGRVSNCNFEGVTDLSVDGEYPYLNFTLTMDASNMVVGDIEGKPSGSVVPLAGVEIKLEIRNSNGDLVETYTQNTDDNGQISYDYSHLPVGAYKYNATYLDGKSKEGTFGTVEVEGDKFSDIQNAIDSLDSGGVIILKDITYQNDIDNNMIIGNPIKIIGNGAVLDAEGESRVFNINSNNVYVENVTFINGNAENGGAIYIGNDCHNEDINNCTFKGNSATSGTAIYCEGTSDGKVSDCNFEGVSDLNVDGGYPELTLTLATDLSNAVVGNIEGKPSGTIPLVDEEIKLDIYDSNGDYVETFTDTTDSNGQIVYNYAHLPLDTYKYNATYLDGKSKEGTFGVVIVEGNGFSDIQNAIDNADPGTVLVLKNITYLNDIDGNMDIDKSITIIGNGAVLDAEGKSRIFDIHSSNVNLDNISFINGVANDGGAVYIADGSNNIDIYNSTFSNNAASNDGGAIFIQHNTYALNFNNVTFTENTAGRGGGGVKSYSTGSGVNFDNCSFIKNNATGDAGGTDSEFGGGGLWCYNTVTHITNCTFDSNRGSYGGALRGAVNVKDSEMKHNVAFNGNGGAIDLTMEGSIKPELYIEDTKFINNTATDTLPEGHVYTEDDVVSQGGAVHVYDIDKVEMYGCELYNNSAKYRGGGLDFYILREGYVENCTYENNTAIVGGGTYIMGDKSRYFKGNFTNIVASHNNATQDGGAFYIEGSNGEGSYVAFDNVTSNHNIASRGGSTYILCSDVLIMNSTFNDNEAFYDGSLEDSGTGGAIHIHGNNVNLINITSNNNDAYRGGSTFIRGANTNVENSTFDNNKATLNGGGLNIGGDYCTITNVDSSENEAGKYGGGIYVDGDTCTITNVTADNNTADDSGGGIYVDGDNCKVMNAEISDCEASMFGGAIAISGNNNRFTNITSMNNEAMSGGSVYIDGNDATIENSTFSENTAIYGGAISITGDNCKFIYNNITDNHADGDSSFNPAGGGVYVEGKNTNFTHNNISSNSAFANGGGIFTNGEYLYIEDLYAENNTAQNGGFAAISDAKDLIVKDSTFISNHANGDINMNRGEGGVFHIFNSQNAEIEGKFYNNTGTNGSSIYVQNSTLRIHDSHFADNQAYSYWLPITPENNTKFNQTDNIGISVRLRGGDNIANAIHNRDGKSDILVNNITYLFYTVDGEVINKTTPNRDMAPVVGPNPDDIYIYDFENNQVITLVLYNGTGNFIYNETTGEYDYNGTGVEIARFEYGASGTNQYNINKTDINGTINVVLNNFLGILDTGNYTICAIYRESSYYTAIFNYTTFEVVNELVKKLTVNNSVLLGDNVDFVVVVNNTNNFTLHNVTITEIFNSNELEYISHTNSDVWIKNGNVFTYKGELKTNESANFTITFKTLKLGTIVNTVNLTTNETGNRSFITRNKTLVYNLLEKLTVNQTVVLGENVDFVVIVNNKNNFTLHNITITEIFNSTELVYVNHTNMDMWVKEGDVFKYNGDLAANQSANFTITFKTLKVGTLINTVNLTTNETGSRIINASNITVVYNLLKKLTVNKTVILGENVSFVVIVNNTNNFTLHNVTITEIFNSTELSYVGHTNNATWIKEGNVFKYNGELGVNQSASFTITFKTLVNGTIINTVNLTTNETKEKVFTANNNTTVYKPNMTVQKITLNETVNLGENVSFIIVVTNTGDCNLTNIKITEIFNSTELEFKDWTNKDKWSKSGDVFIYNGILSVDSSISFTVVFKTLVNGTLINTVNATSNETDNKTSNNKTNVYSTEVNVTKVWNDSDDQDGIRPNNVTIQLLADGVKVNETMLNATKGWKFTFGNLPVYKEGQKIVYSIEELDVAGYTKEITNVGNNYTVTNTHEVNLTEINVTKVWNDENDYDHIRPNNVTVYLLADGVKVNETMLNATKGWKFTFGNLPVNKNGLAINYTIVELAVEDYNTTISYNSSEITIINSHIRPNMTVDKFTIDKVVFVGDNVTFMIVVTNTGNCNLSDVKITEIYNSNELTLLNIKDKEGKWSRSGDIFSYNGNLTAGQSTNFTIFFKTLVNGTLINTVNASSNETDNKTANNNTTVYNPDMTVEKIALNTTVYVGDNIYFMIVVTNTGDCDLSDVVVTEIYNANELTLVDFDNKSLWSMSGDVFTYNGVLAPNESANFTVWFTTLVNGTLINTINASSNETDNKSANNTTVVKNNLCDVEIKKLVNASNVYVNDFVEWTIVVVNKGPITAEDVVVEDMLPNGIIITYSSHSYEQKGNNIIWKLGDLKANDPINIVLITQVISEGRKDNFVVVNTTTNESRTDNNKANNTTFVNPICDLIINKTVNASEVYVNDSVEWVISVINVGSSTAQNVYVKDFLPEGVVITSFIPPSQGSFDEKTRIWEIGELRSNESVSLVLVTKILRNGTITNIVVVNTTTNESNKTNNEANNTTVANSICDLIINKTVNASSVCVGDNVEWTINVVNVGPSTALDVIVKDALPEGVVIISSYTADGRFDEKTRIWEIGELRSNESVSLVLVTKILIEGVKTNIVTVNTSTYEPNKTNNEANNTTVANPICDLEITKIVNSSIVYVDDLVVWTIEVVNHGPSTAKDVKVYDILPDGLKLVKVNPSIGTYANGIWTIGDLNVNNTVSLELTTQAEKLGIITNIAVVNTTTPDSNESNNKANNTTEVIPVCDLEITKLVNQSSVNVTDLVVWTIEVVNHGPSTAKDVKVYDILPDGLKLVKVNPSIGTYANGIWAIGDLNVNNTVSLELITQAIKVGNITNIAVVNTTTHDTNHSNNKANNTTEVIPVCDLTIIKLVSSKKAFVGEELVWTIRVTNLGPSAAVDVTVLEDIPSSLKLINADASKGTYNWNTNIWSIDRLESGSSETLTIRTLVLSVGNITNPVEVSSTTPDSNKSNNKANNTTEAFAIVDLEVKKVSDKNKYHVNDTICWTITVINHGPCDAHDVVAIDVLPSTVNFTSYYASKGSYNVTSGKWTIGDLANGESVTLTIYCVALVEGFITNYVNVTCKEPDSNLDNNYANSTVEIVNETNNSTTPEHPVEPVKLKASGNPITYLLVVIFVLFGSFWARNRKE